MKPRDDEGAAIVVALLVTMIVFVLVSGILAQSIHNITQSGYARRRLVAVNAAEAGLNWFANEASRSQLALLSSPGLWSYQADKTKSDFGWYSHWGERAASKPETTWFVVRVIYSSWNPCQTLVGGVKTDITCTINPAKNPQFLANVIPLVEPFPSTVYAVVRSVGIVGGPSSPGDPTKIDTECARRLCRALESFVRLRAIRNGITGGLMATSVCLSSGAHIQVLGDFAVDYQPETPTSFESHCKNGNLDIQPNDSLVLQPAGTMGGNLQIRGGGLVVSSNATVDIPGDIWVEGKIELGGTGSADLDYCPPDKKKLDGTLNAYQCIGDDAIGTSITYGPRASVAGDPVPCDPACPPPPAFPEISWDPVFWESQGYTVVPITDVATTAGRTSLISQMISRSSPTVFFVSKDGTKTVAATDPAKCDLSLGGQTVTISTKIAVVSVCRFRFETSPAHLRAIGLTDNFAFVSAWPAKSCNPVGTDVSPQDIVISNNQDFSAPVFLYSPCVLWIDGNHAKVGEDPVNGQFVARYMILKNGVRIVQNTLLSKMVGVPGGVAGFKQDLKFVREIQWCKVRWGTSADVACPV